jgi:hypothetical protein
MTENQKQAYQAGVRDAMAGWTGAIKQCKAAAKAGDENCAAYVKGFEGSGAGE